MAQATSASDAGTDESACLGPDAASVVHCRERLKRERWRQRRTVGSAPQAGDHRSSRLRIDGRRESWTFASVEVELRWMHCCLDCCEEDFRSAISTTEAE